ncbi:helicase associated domain-containing protein [Streptomyces sp. NPDC002215]|uniref:helicase associated domain-containing protein n=1 Tax=Streptomyces sp. NPDC002215 TaxID=3154412 RepID=UPI003333E2CE
MIMRVNSPSKGRRDSLDYAPYANIDHGGCIGGYPLGRWVAEQRRAYGAGVMEAKRVVKLEKLGTVWSEQEAAWTDGVAVARACAAAPRPLPPLTDAV